MLPVGHSAGSGHPSTAHPGPRQAGRQEGLHRGSAAQPPAGRQGPAEGAQGGLRGRRHQRLARPGSGRRGLHDGQRL